jgi:hypothetical protein
MDGQGDQSLFGKENEVEVNETTTMIPTIRQDLIHALSSALATHGPMSVNRLSHELTKTANLLDAAEIWRAGMLEDRVAVIVPVTAHLR